MFFMENLQFYDVPERGAESSAGWLIQYRRGIYYYN
jgi:hypothetical protein